jgi:hypothetical protein
MLIRPSCVRSCANKVVVCVRLSTLLLNIRPLDTRQVTSEQQINQLEGLAVAIPWGFESPFRTIRLSFQLAFGEPKGSLMASHPDTSNVLSEQVGRRRRANSESKSQSIQANQFKLPRNHDDGIVVE